MLFQAYLERFYVFTEQLFFYVLISYSKLIQNVYNQTHYFSRLPGNPVARFWKPQKFIQEWSIKDFVFLMPPDRPVFKLWEEMPVNTASFTHNPLQILSYQPLIFIFQRHSAALTLIFTSAHTQPHRSSDTQPSPPLSSVSCSATSLSFAPTSWVPAVVGREEVLTIVFSCLVTKQHCHTSLPD